jgi:RNA polymerase sigma factor (sigma-70 family)
MTQHGDETSWTLVGRAAAGDAGSREAFARIYGPVISAYLSARWRKPPQHEEVLDAVNEVFLQCFKAGGALGGAEQRRAGGFRAYLYGITRNVAGTLRRRSALDVGVEEETLERVDAELSPSQTFDRAFAEAITREARYLMSMWAATDSAAALRLKALELMYEESLPSREVAARLGLEPEAVYPLLSRARKDFKAALLQVMAERHLGETRPEIERRCIDVLGALARH